MKMSGIYKIESKIKPGRIYIGSAVSVKHRWAVHLHTLRKNKHHSRKLQRHYNKYGEEDLVFIIVELCLPQFLIVREQYYLDNGKAYFNNCKIAGSPLGIKHSIEDNRKNSERLRGRVFSDETRRKISEAKAGVPLTEEHRKKLSQIKKGKGIGHFVSEETRRRIGEANKRRVISEETRNKYRSRIGYNKGVPMSEEQKEKRRHPHKKCA